MGVFTASDTLESATSASSRFVQNPLPNPLNRALLILLFNTSPIEAADLEVAGDTDRRHRG
ncbi:MAG TPA: hypothetical protein P5186_05300 [Candidatus Paceibacterota bacterium]|nr:hypothetical protein [Candidatus Paceibacterota bacterium]